MAKQVKAIPLLPALIVLIFFAGCLSPDTFLIINSDTANGFSQSFTNSDLINGQLILTHGLDVNVLEVQVYDSSRYAVEPDLITKTDGNTVTIDLSSFAPISGTWNAVIISRVFNAHLGYFDSNDLASGILVETHNLGSADIGVQVWNDSNELVESDYVLPTSVSTVEVGLNSHTVSGVWSVVVLEAQSTVDYVVSYTSVNLDGNIFTIVHNLDSTDVAVYLYNDSGYEFYPDVQAVSDSRVRVDLTGFVPISGTWYAEVFSTGGSAIG